MSSAKGLSCLWPKCVNDQIRLQIWTRVMVVVMCEDLWSDLFIRIIIKAEGIFIKFQLWAHKLFVKWVHGAHHNLNWREICLDSGHFMDADFLHMPQQHSIYLTHLPLVPHICISELGPHWFRWWLVAYSVPGHYLNQCWVIVNWTLVLGNKLQWNFNQSK